MTVIARKPWHCFVGWSSAGVNTFGSALAVLVILAAFQSPARGQDVPTEVALPAGIDPAKSWKLIRVEDGKAIPCQFTSGGISFLAGSGKCEYRLMEGKPEDHPKVRCVDDGAHLTILIGEKSVLRYNYATIPQRDPTCSRSGYIHPIWTPSGKIVTNDSPSDLPHHHGLWSAWSSAVFEGRGVNFWDSRAKRGRVECVTVEGTVSGPVFAGFKARHRFIDVTAPEGEKAALEELWDVRVYALSESFVFDLVSTQTCTTDQPLSIKEHIYGGIGFRGAGAWMGKAGAEFLTGEGKGRLDGNATKAKWCIAMGKVEGSEASIGFLCHPSDCRFPQPMRIHPDVPFFSWAVPQGGDLSIAPGKPYVSRYRFIIADGRITRDAMDAAWKAYGESSQVCLIFQNKD